MGYGVSRYSGCILKPLSHCSFIADIEKVLRQWGLADTSDEPTLVSTSDSQYRFLLTSALLIKDPHRQQHRKSEQLLYAGRRFVMKLEVSGGADLDSHTHSGPEDPDKQGWSSGMFEMMDHYGDFPPRSHPISRW